MSTKWASEGLIVVGAGYPRTGTMTLKSALDSLGLPAHHMSEIRTKVFRGGESWFGKQGIFASELSAEQIEENYGTYRSAVDFPCAMMFEELMDHYEQKDGRKVKVILTMRETPEKWWKSLNKTVARAIRFYQSWMGRLILPTIFVRGVDHLSVHLGGARDKDKAIECYNRHNERVMRDIPSDRLLIMVPSKDYETGYDQLIDFLEIDDEQILKEFRGKPFPRTNNESQFVRDAAISVLRRQLEWNRLAILVGIGAIIWYLTRYIVDDTTADSY